MSPDVQHTCFEVILCILFIYLLQLFFIHLHVDAEKCFGTPDMALKEGPK